MRRKVHSKSGLFLIELMFAITFFAITASIFMQVFVKSHNVSKEAEDLFQAQSLASSVAEIMEGLDEETDFAEGLAACFPEWTRKTPESVEGYYDEEWRTTNVEKASRTLMVSWEENGQMWDVEILVLTEEKEIYRLDLEIFRRRTEKGGEEG